MTESARIRWINDGRRLHFRHGPIDLVVELQGDKHAVHAAIQYAASVFPQILPELVRELSLLRTPLSSQTLQASGAVARLMINAAKRHSDRHYLTPMISVAGSVADYMLHMLTHRNPLSRVYVNNGGDIALFLADGQSFDIAVCDNITESTHSSTLRIDASSRVRGLATSGWRGRSHSLGVADAVTVLAHNAASADVAATLIANAVDVPESSRVTRVPARELSADSDLENQLVTVNVDPLTRAEVMQAIDSGASVALHMLQSKLIDGVLIAVQGKTRVIGSVCQSLLATA